MRRLLITAAMLAFSSPIVAQGTIKANPNSDKPVVKPVEKKADADVHFRNCSEARANGYSRMRRGEPGYAPHLDRDNDGIACE